MGALDYGEGLYGIGDRQQGKKKKGGHQWSTSVHMNTHLG